MENKARFAAIEKEELVLAGILPRFSWDDVLVPPKLAYENDLVSMKPWSRLGCGVRTD